MDTSETQTAPVGVEGATSSQDTAAQVTTQPETQEQTSSEGTQEPSGEASTLLAGKYKSAEELEKAYLEAQKKISEYGQKAKVADVIQEKYGITPEQLQAQIEAQEEEAKRQYYASNPLAPYMDEVAQLKQMVQQQEAEKAYNAEQQKLGEFIAKNPEYAPFKDKIMELAMTNPKYLQDDSIGYEDIANEWFGQARSQGQQDAYNKIETKKTQTTGPTAAQKKTMSYADLKESMPLKDRIKAFEQMMGN